MSAADLQTKIASNPAWYHTIELAPGVTTPGHVDMRPVAPKIFPERIEGRALDIGTFDGFWAFELERRGAETVAIDVDRIEAADWPPIHRDRLEQAARDFQVELGLGFRIAKEALGSSVERVPCSVYDVSPERIGGPVDFAFLGALLLHMRDPVRALEGVHRALRPGGTLQLFEPIDVRLTLQHPRRPCAEFSVLDSEFNWWYPNLSALVHWAHAAGFTDVKRGKILRPMGRWGMRGIVYCAVRARRP